MTMSFHAISVGMASDSAASSVLAAIIPAMSEAGITPEELAQTLDLTPHAMQKILTGKAFLRLSLSKPLLRY